jgi:hypothetical protein
MNSTLYRLGGAASVLTAAALLAMSIPAAAATISLGTLRLNLGSTNQWVYGSTTQQVKVKGSCELDQSSAAPTLVAISTTNGTPGFNKQKEWFGVKENSNGVGCGRISGDQSLTLSLTGALTSKVVNKTTLALNAKKNVIITATTYIGSTPTGSYVLKTGGSAPVGVEPNSNEAFCSAGVSDSNPDSNADCVWVFPNTDKTNKDTPADWDHVTFTVSVGEFGLGGVNTISTFEVGAEVDGQINCGDQTIAVGDGITVPFAQCTRLDNADSTLSGGPSGNNCQVVDYSLDTNCDGSDCTVRLLHGLSGTQDATQFRFLCTINWTGEDILFGSAPDYSSSISLSQLYWGTDDSVSTRQLDYCPGATVKTDPPGCEPGTVAVTGAFTFPTDYSIELTSASSGLEAFQGGDVVSVATGTDNDGIYTVAADGATATTLTFTTPLTGTPGSSTSSGSVTRLSGCPIVDFDFSGIPTELQDMSTTLPGNQRACLLEQLETQCNAAGPSQDCLQQTFGVEGDTTIRRF